MSSAHAMRQQPEALMVELIQLGRAWGSRPTMHAEQYLLDHRKSDRASIQSGARIPSFCTEHPRDLSPTSASSKTYIQSNNSSLGKLCK